MTRFAILCAGGVTLFAASPALAQDAQHHVDISPYIEVSQVLSADLQQGDVLTYTSVAAGVDASVETRRVSVALNYQYERRFFYDRGLNDDDVHSGAISAQVRLTRGLSVEAGALAARGRSDIRGDAPGNLVGNPGNTSQVYSAYVGPSFSTQAGPASVAASYRFGYTKAEAPSATGVNPNAPRLDNYDSSTSHLATASVGTRAGDVLPVGLTASGAYEREDANQLDQRYEGKYVRGDAVLPVTPTVALVGGVGYEKIDIDQRDPLFDADGNPVVDRNGRFVTDPASPRRSAYASDGVIWDAGVIWRPNQRFEFEARVGRRYDTITYTGSINWQTGQNSGLQVGVYDSVESFGRQLTGSLAALPRTSILNSDDPFSSNYSGCLFAGSNGAAGGCLNRVFQSIATSNFRARGVDAIFSTSRGSNRFGVGAGYANRSFYAPDLGSGFTVNGITDDSYYAQLFAARALSSDAGINGNIYGNYYNSGIAGAGDVWGTGANGSVYRRFGRLNAELSAGIYSFDQEGATEADITAQALLALGYSF